MAEFAALSGFLFFFLGLAILIVFFIMASNIGSIVRILRRMEMHSMHIKNSLEKMNSKVATDAMSDAEKARAYDRGQKI